ncbi:MAG: hypothetical protein V4594_12105 [Bacteroidota bacterium]
MLKLTAIDGGVLVDPFGSVYAYGVILDGIVGAHGDSSRGSRYNSAITYHESKADEHQLMIVIVSEDSTVDIIPNLRDQIKRSEIQRSIQLFEDLSIESDNIGNFNHLMQWFKTKRFYLTASECEKINELRRNFESQLKGRTVSIIFQDLVPDPQMNDSYYEEEA